ncbi:MAG: hypothetical protein RLZZ01_2063 [Actinomycetota bacterium]
MPFAGVGARRWSISARTRSSRAWAIRRAYDTASSSACRRARNERRRSSGIDAGSPRSAADTASGRGSSRFTSAPVCSLTSAGSRLIAHVDSAPRHRREHRDLVVGCDRIVIGGRLTVHPDPTRPEDGGEARTITVGGVVEHLAHLRSRQIVSAGARRLSRCCEQTDDGHVLSVVARRSWPSRER